MGAPALHVHAYEYDAEDFRFNLGGDIDVDYLPAPDIHQRDHRTPTPLGIPAFGQAVTAVKGWWTEEFTFRGFGIGVVKPVFRGTFLRPDVGVGIRCAALAVLGPSRGRQILECVAQALHVRACWIVAVVRIAVQCYVRDCCPALNSAW